MINTTPYPHLGNLRMQVINQSCSVLSRLEIIYLVRTSVSGNARYPNQQGIRIAFCYDMKQITKYGGSSLIFFLFFGSNIFGVCVFVFFNYSLILFNTTAELKQ